MNQIDPEISKLLRLKRYEQPPAGYHEKFLQEFQRRQRIEALHTNPVERFFEWLRDFSNQIRIPSYAYATVGLFAVAMSSWILSSEEVRLPNRSTASLSASELRLDLTPKMPEVLPLPVNIPSQRFVGTLPPQYILQKSPASENDPFRF